MWQDLMVPVLPLVVDFWVSIPQIEKGVHAARTRQLLSSGLLVAQDRPEQAYDTSHLKRQIRIHREQHFLELWRKMFQSTLQTKSTSVETTSSGRGPSQVARAMASGSKVWNDTSGTWLAYNSLNDPGLRSKFLGTFECARLTWLGCVELTC